MSEGKRSLAVAEAIGTRQPLSIAAPQPRQVSPSKEKTIYFGVSIYDNSDPEDPEPVEALQAGKQYLLVITCDETPSSINEHLKQDGKPVSGPFSLILSFSYDVNVTTPITPAKAKITFDALFDDQYTYEFIVPEEIPKCNISIKLRLKTQQRPLGGDVVRYSIPVQGQEEPQELEIFTISQINRHLPEKTAILLVETAARQMAHEQHLHLRGWSEVGQQLDEVVLMNVIVSVEELQVILQREQNVKEADPDEILSRLRNFSRKNSQKLLGWLDRLFNSYQEPFNLIIVDFSDREIPWELLEFEPDLYLGTYARVVRWLRAQYFMTQRVLSIEPRSHKGPVLSYLDGELGLQRIHDEQSALQRLVSEPFPTLHKLRKRLGDSLEGVGMVYIGCHGLHGQDLLQQKVSELSSIKLEGIFKCDSPLLTVFLNACESARTAKKSRHNTSNFVDAFLAHCASGFIGTLAQVDVRTASELAGRILSSMSQSGGVQIAEQLRLLRKEEMERLKQKKEASSATEADYYRVIDTFMYVYYGNPLARLQLYIREESGA